jgi:hypothetical protein
MGVVLYSAAARRPLLMICQIFAGVAGISTWFTP